MVKLRHESGSVDDRRGSARSPARVRQPGGARGACVRSRAVQQRHHEERHRPHQACQAPRHHWHVGDALIFVVLIKRILFETSQHT